MNIFFLSYSPEQSARWLGDRHVIKMILESAQLLSTAHRVLDGYKLQSQDKMGRDKIYYVLEDVRYKQLYQATNVNHPCAEWVRESNVNYDWLYDHFVALLDEYLIRFKKAHKCEKLRTILGTYPLNIPKLSSMTAIRCVMIPTCIISDDPITNYRYYYKTVKASLHKWTNREVPNWINDRVAA